MRGAIILGSQVPEAPGSDDWGPQRGEWWLQPGRLEIGARASAGLRVRLWSTRPIRTYR